MLMRSWRPLRSCSNGRPSEPHHPTGSPRSIGVSSAEISVSESIYLPHAAFADFDGDGVEAEGAVGVQWHSRLGPLWPQRTQMSPLTMTTHADTNKVSGLRTQSLRLGQAQQSRRAS